MLRRFNPELPREKIKLLFKNYSKSNKIAITAIPKTKTKSWNTDFQEGTSACNSGIKSLPPIYKNVQEVKGTKNVRNPSTLINHTIITPKKAKAAEKKLNKRAFPFLNPL